MQPANSRTMAFAKWQDNGPLYLLQCSLRVSGSRLSVSVMKVWILIVGRRGAGGDIDCGKIGGGGVDCGKFLFNWRL